LVVRLCGFTRSREAVKKSREKRMRLQVRSVGRALRAKLIVSRLISFFATSRELLLG
jgi:hypothetical protein